MMVVLVVMLCCVSVCVMWFDVLLSFVNVSEVDVFDSVM